MKAVFCFAILCGSLSAEPRFLGVLGTAKDGTFFAVAVSEHTSSKWLRIGDPIDGYVIAGYRPKEEQLVLRKAGEELVLPLKTSKIRDGMSFVDEASIRKLAREIIAKWEGWDAATAELVVWYKSDWNVAAVRIVDGKKETRIISAPDGFSVSAP